jgi:hypothetical protein
MEDLIGDASYSIVVRIHVFYLSSVDYGLCLDCTSNCSSKDNHTLPILSKNTCGPCFPVGEMFNTCFKHVEHNLSIRLVNGRGPIFDIPLKSDSGNIISPIALMLITSRKRTRNTSKRVDNNKRMAASNPALQRCRQQ